MIFLCTMLLYLLSLVCALPIAFGHPAFDGVIRPEGDGSFSAYMIPPYASNHASTIEVLPDGRLAAAWFSGKAEEASGCAIVFSRLNGTSWTTAATLSKRDGYSNQNPVLFYDKVQKRLHLFHSQAAASSGESMAQIWHLQSDDLGDTWTKPKAWLTVPGAFSRNRIIPSGDGGVMFPFYNASNANSKFDNQNYAIFGFSGPDRNIGSTEGWNFMPLAGSQYLVQPSTVHLSDSWLTLFRDRRSKNIYASSAKVLMSNDWSDPSPTQLPNNNAGIEANTLISGDIVLVFNPTTHWRDPLAIAISKDNGKSWTCQRNLQHGVSEKNLEGKNKGPYEFSYPTVLQTSDGNIHVMYTYLRETIKYKRVTEEWICNGQRV